VTGDPLVGDAADAARVEHVPPPTAAKPERSLPQPIGDDNPTVAASPHKYEQLPFKPAFEPLPPLTAAKPERSLPQPIGHVMQFFHYEHLPAHLREVSQPFGELASWLVLHCPHNPELTVALRKLLESKDAAVRAVIAG
jgi:hypothetical protein